MLPDWDFDDDDLKRYSFINWILGELVRFDAMLAQSPDFAARNWAALLSPGVRRAKAGRPGSSLESINGMVRDYLVIRYMFGRYWPGRRRPVADSASAINIAVARQFAVQTSDARAKLAADAQYLSHSALTAEIKKGIRSVDVGRGKPREKSLGRKQAEADIAVLSALRANLFPR